MSTCDAVHGHRPGALDAEGPAARRRPSPLERLSKGARLRLDLALPRLSVVPGAVTSPSEADAQDVILTDRAWRESERQNLLKALERTNGRIDGQGGAAELLGVNPTTLASRLRALTIATPKPR